jgi:hypothetical protein
MMLGNGTLIAKAAYRAGFTPVGNDQLFSVVCEACQFEAQFTLCEEANYERFFAAVRRGAKKFG